jgi:adenylate cyclase
MNSEKHKNKSSSKSVSVKKAPRKGASINFKFSLGFGFLLAILLVVVALVVADQTRTNLNREVLERGATVARNLAANSAEPLTLQDSLSLMLLVRGAVQESMETTETEFETGVWTRVFKALFEKKESVEKNEGIVRALILDKQGLVVADRMSAGYKGQDLSYKLYEAPDYLKQSVKTAYPVFLSLEGEQIFDIQIPIFSALAGELGSVRIHLRRAIIDEAVFVAMVRLVLVMSLLGLFFIVAMAFIIRRMLRPISYLMDGVKSVSKGDFGLQIKYKARDELGELVGAYNNMASSLKEKETVQEALAKYTSKDLVSQMLSDKSKLELGGKRVYASIFFSVVRGLAALSGKLEAEKYVGIINEYLEVETDIILKNNGTIDKFIGDEVMALWGLSGEDPAQSAYLCVKSAVEIQEALIKLNDRRKQRGQPMFQVSIGINSGEVVAGNMGSSVKMDYTVLGSNVNLAARLGLIAAKGGQTIISPKTYEVIGSRFVIEVLEPVILKGIKEPVPLYWARNLLEN